MNEKKPVSPTKLPKFVYVLLGVLLLSIAVYVIALISPTFADFFNTYPGAAIRALLAWCTNLLPFSLAEIFIVSIPALIAITAILAYKSIASPGARLLYLPFPFSPAFRFSSRFSCSDSVADTTEKALTKNWDSTKKPSPPRSSRQRLYGWLKSLTA